jgi:hypothetical protein
MMIEQSGKSFMEWRSIGIRTGRVSAQLDTASRNAAAALTAPEQFPLSLLIAVSSRLPKFNRGLFRLRVGAKEVTP